MDVLQHSATVRRCGALSLGLFWSVLSSAPLWADDTELFRTDSSAFSVEARPNVLLILDTSSSMLSEVQTQGIYDPSTPYSGSCSDSRIYWRTGTGDAPSCDTNQWIERSSLVCGGALDSFESGIGYYTDRMAQFDPLSTDEWQRLSPDQKSGPVECEQDRGVHGDIGGGRGVYAQDGDDTQLWSASASDEVSWGQNPVDRSYTIYDGNYLNWLSGPTTTLTRIQVMKDVASNVLNSTTGVNVGLMAFNPFSGGPVLHPVENIEESRASILRTIDELQARDLTPLSETLYEAGQYFAGRAVEFGDAIENGSQPSVPESRLAADPGVYRSPIEYGCQRNFAVVLTDGAPKNDLGANWRVPRLPGYAEIIGPSCDSGEEGACLEELASYLFNADLNPDLPGQQNVVTHTIGFAIDLPLLATTAENGGGNYFTANDSASLSAALTNIVTAVMSTQTSFTSPMVSVDSFNRTQSRNEIYLTVFEPTANVHWPGNLKKYRIRPTDGAIVDANGTPAIDPATSTFSPGSRSLWAFSPDGAEAALGGAANQLPDPSQRNVFTYLGTPLLADASNRVHTGNASIDDALLGLGNPGDPTRAELIDFIRGVDVTDSNLNGNTVEPRNSMGDPLHSRPVTVTYGGSVANPDSNDAIVFFSTNDGFLHAIDPATGEEKWTFIPPEFLSDQTLLFANEPDADKHYGIDGNLQIQMLTNNNGVVEPGIGEKVYLYFGMRRGGAVYYALDITVPEAPQLLWRSDSTDLPGLGQSWSTPIPTRLNIQGANQNTEKLALIFGGGYDPSQDNDAASTDSSGNAIYIVDSVSGERLWHASADGADLNVSEMRYSFPSDMKVLDLNGDMFADRIYAADMGGQLWRFDIFNGESTDNLVNGGVIAQLGGAPLADPTIADNRRFYYAPDVALVNDDNNSFFHIGIGSGHRAHPNGTVNQDRFFALRDYNAFGTNTQLEYETRTPIRDEDLVDVTDDLLTNVPIGSPGWKLELRDGGWQGEKILAEARTFNNQIIFTTFTPASAASANDCEPSPGTNRVYVLDLFNGAPVNNLDGLGDDDELTISDRFEEFEGSIASEAILIFPSPEDPTCVGDQCNPPPLACVDLFCFPAGFTNEPVRTFWSQESAR